MPTREEMRSLAEDIVGSYADRVAGIAQIRQAESERKRTETREISQRKSDVSTMLKEFDKEQAAMSQELKAKLASDEQERHQTTAQEISQRKSDVGTMLKEFDKEQAAMSQELKADLSKVAPAIKQAEGERKRTETREISQRKSDVSTMLKEFDKEQAAMSQELRTKLASDEQERHQTTAREIAQRKSDVSTMLREYDKEQAGVRDEWQILTATMQAQRVGLAVETKPSEAFAAPAEEITKEEAAEITPEIGDIRDRAFEYLANHPDGTRLVELEEEFGLARIQIAKIVKSLMDENKVEKRELSYFAI